MAYVFVQHLDPSHGSLLVEILSKRAGFPVEEAREGVKIHPDHLYVIAPNTTLTIGGDVLHLRSREIQISCFFRICTLSISSMVSWSPDRS